MPDTPSFTTVGDEPLEARIVSWVLGDTSAFEAAELERLCEERPELLVFRRRMRALHGLLTEAEAAQPDLGWKLPPPKRKVLDELFGTPPKLKPLSGQTRARRSRRANWWLYSVAACVVGLLAIAGFGAGGMAMKKAKEVASQASADDLVALNPEYPRELIEGTPKRIYLPGVVGADEKLDGGGEARASGWQSRTMEAPATGPAVPLDGLSDFSDSLAMNGKDQSGLEKSMEPPPTPGQPARPLASARKPGAPTSSMARAAPSPQPELEAGERLRERVEELASRMPEDRIMSGEAEMSNPRGSITSGARVSIPGLKPSDAAVAKSETLDHRIRGESVSDPLGSEMSAGSGIRARDGSPPPEPEAEPPPPLLAGNDRGTHGDEGLKKQIAGDDFVRPGAGGASAPDTDVRFAFRDRWQVQDDAREGETQQGGFGGGGGTGGGGTLTTGGLAQREMIRRQSAVNDSERLLTEGRGAYQDGDFAKAKEKFKTADEILPDAPLAKNRKDAIAGHLSLADTALAEKALRTGDHEPLKEAKKLFESAVETDPNSRYAKEELAKLEERNRPPSLSDGRDANAESAYDQTKAELLMEVDKAWESALPADQQAAADKSSESAMDKAGAGYVLPSLPGNLDTSDPEALAKAISRQEDAVNDSRKTLATIVRNKGIIYYGTDSPLRGVAMDEEKMANAAVDNYTTLETEKAQLESMTNTLLKYGPEQSTIYAAGLDLPDNVVRSQLPKYLDMKSQLEGMKKQGMGDSHPQVVAKQQELEAMRGQLDEGVEALKDTLRAKLELANARLNRAEEHRNATKGKAVSSAIDRQDYEDARQEFESQQARLQAMRLKQTELAIKGIKAQPKAPPKPKPADFGAEISASEDPYSTFSLNVSDASFKTAQAALAKGAQPDPASIRVEQFYNAMDYGDPSPALGEPVAAKIEQSAHPVIPGRNLVRVALRTAATGRGASQPLRLTLLIDQSGSMARDDRRQAMTLALRELATLLTPQDRVTVVGFSLQPRLLADSAPGDQLAKLPALANPEANEGGTNLELALELGRSLALSRRQEGAQNRIVLFTDGAANLGNANPAVLAETVKQLRQQGLAFDVAGLGTSELNDRLLAELSRHGNGRYYVVDAAADEPNGFAKQLAGAFRPAAENVKVQVRFDPNRVGGYRLVGFEEHRLKQEDFRNDAVDAAELAAEEAGVALYQVEPLPSGSGDLGEVSVRFRDVASGRMVERSWSIPYDPSAPAFDQAAPSMQLAGLAMLGAEKLRGGAMADAIDFASFIPSRTTVRQTFPNNRRVAELLEMIERLR